MGVKSYRDLNVWQVSMDLVEAVYRLTDTFPDHERFGLRSQLQRAMVSVPANIAEGHGRSSTKQYLFHTSVAKGSLCETETYLLLAERLRYSSRHEIASLLARCDRIGRMLSSLQKSLSAKIRSP